MKKVETKKKVEKKVIWGAKSESGFKTLVKEARKNKNLFVLACTSSKDEKGTGVRAMLYSENFDLSIAIATALKSIDDQAPGAVEKGIIKFLAHRD